MFTGNRAGRAVAAFVALAAGLVGASLARHEAGPCACTQVRAVPLATLPEVVVVGTRPP